VHDVRRVEVAVVGQRAMSRTAVSPRSVARRACQASRRPGCAAASSAVTVSLDVADQRHVDLDVLADLRGIDLDVDLARPRRVGLEVAGDAVVEAHPEATMRSASWMAWLTHASPCMPIMPMASGWVAGKPPRPSSVDATGACSRFGQLLDQPAGACLDHPRAAKKDRPLGVPQELERSLQVARPRRGARDGKPRSFTGASLGT
jgi:hypothetical protein